MNRRLMLVIGLLLSGSILGAIPAFAHNTCLSSYPLRLTNHHYAYTSNTHSIYVFAEGGGFRAVKVSLSGHAATCGYHTYTMWSASVSSSLPDGSVLTGSVWFQRSDGRWFRHPTPFSWKVGSWPTVPGGNYFLMELDSVQYPSKVYLVYSASGDGWASQPKTVTCTLGYMGQTSYSCTATP